MRLCGPLLLASALAACGPSPNPAREAIDRAKAAPAAAEGRWTCPMHPEVRAGGPGACPQCGMPLAEGES